MSEYTKGPWRHYTKPQPNGCPIVGTGYGLMVAQIAHSVNEPDQHDIAVANAKLITAAPDLFEALQDALSDLEFLKNAPGSSQAKPVDGTIKAARAALTKAGGLSTVKKNDREILELAAKAAGYKILGWNDQHGVDVAILVDGSFWQPLIENKLTDRMGDAMRLAMKLRLLGAPSMELQYIMAMGADDPEEATCRAIVCAAANKAGDDESTPLKIHLPLNSFMDDWDASGMDAYDDL